MDDISYIGRERRKYQRLRIRLAIIYQVNQPLGVRMQIGEREILATALDLSEAGISISTDYDIPLQTNLLIKFTLFRVDQTGKINLYGPMEITGEVRSNILIENKIHRLGISFQNLEENDKKEITNFINIAFNNPAT